MIPVSIVGMGMSPTDLTERHLGIIRNAQVLVGGDGIWRPLPISMWKPGSWIGILPT